MIAVDIHPRGAFHVGELGVGREDLEGRVVTLDKKKNQKETAEEEAVCQPT